jgi:hypothetical protein
LTCRPMLRKSLMLRGSSAVGGWRLFGVEHEVDDVEHHENEAIGAEGLEALGDFDYVIVTEHMAPSVTPVLARRAALHRRGLARDEPLTLELRL